MRRDNSISGITNQITGDVVVPAGHPDSGFYFTTEIDIQAIN